MTLASSAAGPLRLGDSPVRVLLASSGDRAGLQRKVAAGHRVELVLSGLSADRQPGIRYRVYFGLPAGAAPDDAHLVQAINFFNDVPLAGALPKPDVPLRFDITALAAKTLAAGGDVAVTLVPEGRTENGAQPQIARIAIVVQE
ncbi:MAG: hypothetical protein WDM91_02300 [Rhizomicrobium sp.]